MKPVICFALFLVLAVSSGIVASAGEIPFDLRWGSSDESIFLMCDRQIGWARGTNGVLRTIDGGQSWQTVLPAAPREPVGCFFYNANTAWAAVGVMDDATNATIFRTTDAGKTWQHTEISDVSPILECLFSFSTKTSGWLMAVADHGMNSEPGTLYHSADSGQTWQLVNSGQWFDDKDSLKSESDWAQPHLPFCGSILFRNNSAGWLVGSYASTTPAYLFASWDGGKNWKGQALPFPASFGPGRMKPSGLPRFFPSDGKKGVIQANFVPQNPDSTNVPTVIYHTHDAGKSWQPGEPIFGGDCASSFYNATEGWLWRDESLWNSRPAQGTLFRTHDGGVYWREIKAQKNLADVLKPGLRVRQLEFVDDQCGWAIALGNTLQAQLLHTGDGGKTWTELCAPADAQTASPWKYGPPYARDGYVLVRLETVAIKGTGYEFVSHSVSATFQPIKFKYPDRGGSDAGGGGYPGRSPFEINPVETKIGKSFGVGMLAGNSMVPQPQESIANLLEACADENNPKHLKLDLILSIPSTEAAANREGEHDYSHWFIESLTVANQ